MMAHRSPKLKERLMSKVGIEEPRVHPMIEPWSHKKRERVKAKIDREAERAAGRLGASHVVLVAFFPEGVQLHMQDGGNPPMDWQKLYTDLATAHRIVEDNDGQDVSLL